MLNGFEQTYNTYAFSIVNRSVILIWSKYNVGECMLVTDIYLSNVIHDDVIKWKHFPRYWPFVRGIHRSPVNSLHKGPWRGALLFSLICARINGWVNNGEADDLRRHHAYYDVTVFEWRGCWYTGKQGARESTVMLMSLFSENIPPPGRINISVSNITLW